MTTHAAEPTCAGCGARHLPVGGGRTVQWVCPRCPLPSGTRPDTLAARWRAWLGEHDIPLRQPPFLTPTVWWVPPARTLLLVASVPHPTVADAAMRRGIEHGWDVVWLGPTPEAMHVLVDSHLDEDTSPARAPRALTLRLDDEALAGRCSSCGVFQWHTQWGWWVCRACGNADGDQTLEWTSLHGPGFTDSSGRPRCDVCCRIWGVAPEG